MEDAPTRPAAWRRRGLLLELGGLLLVVVLAVSAVGHLITTQRSFLLFFDGDSVLPAIIRGSIAQGQPQHWALSPVLFLPELAVYLTIAALGFGVTTTLTINAVVNLVALYAALRFVAGAVVRPFRNGGNGVALSRATTIGGAVLAFVVVVSFTQLESSATKDSLELVSLMMTTTYYPSTLIGTVLTVGFLAQMAAVGEGRPLLRLAILLAGVAALSTFTNPLYLSWAAIPAGAVLAVAVGLGAVRIRAALWMIAPLVFGVGAGLLLRIPFSRFIALTGSSYLHAGDIRLSLDYYGALLRDRLSTPPGQLSLALLAAILLANGMLTVIAWRRRNIAATIVLIAGWAAPVVIVAGALFFGTNAARYLEPVFYAPIAGLTMVPALWRGGSAGARRLAVAAVAVVGLVGATIVGSGITAVSTPMGSAKAETSITCVDEWITASHRVGVGQFWDVRGPKSRLANPRQLIQVGQNLSGYDWLANRADYVHPVASFIISQASTPPFQLPAAVRTLTPSIITCGTYTITDYHRNVLPIGALVY